VTNLVQSVSDRLLNIARARGEDFQFVLVRYGSERLLYRISVHPELREFVLKGASLFLVWEGQWFRTTRDIDLLGYGSTDLFRMERIFQSVCAMESVEVDGLSFDEKTLSVSRIKEDQFYEGIRIRLVAFLGKTRIPLQVDIGFGDAITPGPQSVQFPCLLDAPAPNLLAYPFETALAEKFLAIATLGMQNTRMKDYYDILVLSKRRAFESRALADAIRNTCIARRLPIPKSIPVGLSEAFTQDTEKRRQWDAFVRRSSLSIPVGDLSSVVREVRVYLNPIFPQLSLESSGSVIVSL
jgi:predicted nucleotidyltransferase component of viral defense system